MSYNPKPLNPKPSISFLKGLCQTGNLPVKASVTRCFGPGPQKLFSGESFGGLQELGVWDFRGLCLRSCYNIVRGLSFNCRNTKTMIHPYCGLQ